MLRQRQHGFLMWQGCFCCRHGSQKAPSDDFDGALGENGDRRNSLQLSGNVLGSLATQGCAIVREELRVLSVDLSVLVEVPGISGGAGGKAKHRSENRQVPPIHMAIAFRSPAALPLRA